MVLDNPRARARWCAVDMLIFDEISMVSGEIMDKLDFIARKFAPELCKAFGGVQIIAVGDFHQLEPVPVQPATVQPAVALSHAAARPPKPTLAFESDAWKSLEFVSVVLTQVERQADVSYVKLLAQLRVGVFDGAPKLLETRVRPLEEQLVGAIPHIYTHTRDVDAHNSQQLALLQSPSISFRAVDQL